MKIVQINGTFGYGDSTGTTTKEMHEWLAAHGHSSYVFVGMLNSPDGTPEHVAKYTTDAGTKCHALLSRVFGLQGYFSVHDTKRLARKLHQIKPDAVVLRVLHNNSIHLGILCQYLQKNNIPAVLVLHDCWYYTGHCCYYVQYGEHGCAKWKRGCRHCGHRHDWNNSWFFDTAHKCIADKKRWFQGSRPLAVVGVSDWVTRDAGKSILRNAAIIKRIYNWINFNVFYPMQAKEAVCKRHGLPEDSQIVFAASSYWTEQKGSREVLLAAKRFAKSKMAVIVAGNASDEMRLAGNIICIGLLKDQHLLAQYYSAADVFINPSRFETFGKTTAEALSCGTPVVAYNTTGSRELVGQDRGCIVEPGNAMQFLSALEHVLRVGKGYYADNCVRFSREHFSLDKNMEDYMGIFKELGNCK